MNRPVKRIAGEEAEVFEPDLSGFITAAALKQKSFPPVAWAVPGIAPNGLTLLASKPKLGKSWLMLDVCLAVARSGFCLGDRHCIEGDVLYCALEDGEQRLQDRMAKVCLGPWPERLTFRTQMENLSEGGMGTLDTWRRTAAEPRLIVIDTFAKVRPGKRPDETQYEADYRAAGMLKSFADQHHLALIAVHHVRKMEAEDPFDMVSGTNGLTGAADTILVMKRDAGGVTLYGRGRDVEEFELAMQFQKDACRWRVLGDADEVHKSDERKAVIDALLNADEPLTPTMIADVTGRSRPATRKLLFHMVRDGDVQKVGRGKYEAP